MSTQETQATPTAAQPGAPDEPYRNYHFKLEIEGIVAAHFTEFSGLAARVEHIPYRAGGEGQTVHQLAGQVHYPPVELRYGVTASPSLWQWMQASLRGHAIRKNVSLLYLDPDGVTELTRYNLYEAWPCEWRAAELDALSREVAIETLVLAIESIDRS